MSIARVYSDQTLFDEPTRAVMNVTRTPASLLISKLIPADSGERKFQTTLFSINTDGVKERKQASVCPGQIIITWPTLTC